MGEEPGGNEIYHVLFDGSVTDEHGYVAMGGHAESLTGKLRETFREGWDLREAVRSGVAALSAAEEREIPPGHIEAGVLDRTRRGRRKFHRLTEGEIVELLR